MPVAIFNPNPRFIFSYEDVQKSYGHYKRIVKAIRKLCDSPPIPLQGNNDCVTPDIALAHLTTFCNLTFGMYKKADATLFQCLRVLSKQNDWLKTTMSRTTNTMKRCRIAEAEIKVTTMRAGIVKCRRVMVVFRQRFERWAEEETKTLKDLTPDWLVGYQLGPLIEHTDFFAGFIKGFRKTCLQVFVQEDRPRR